VKGVRLYFATDIHGSETCFKKFLNAGKLYKADAIIMGGDITGKTVTPPYSSPTTATNAVYWAKPST